MDLRVVIKWIIFVFVKLKEYAFYRTPSVEAIYIYYNLYIYMNMFYLLIWTRQNNNI